MYAAILLKHIWRIPTSNINQYVIWFNSQYTVTLNYFQLFLYAIFLTDHIPWIRGILFELIRLPVISETEFK